MTTVLDRSIEMLRARGRYVVRVRKPRDSRIFRIVSEDGNERRVTPEDVIYAADPAWREIDRKMRMIEP